MNWQEGVFGPLLAHTLENAQVRHLAEHYDFSRDSRLAQAIVKHTNQVLDAEEKRRQVLRVRPGELLLRTWRGLLILPLRTPEDVSRVVAGERWDVVRRDILDRCAAKYRELFPEASPASVTRFLRSIWQGRVPPGTAPSPLHGPRRQRPWGTNLSDGKPLTELDAARGRLRLNSGPPRPGHLPETFRQLAHFLGTQAGIPPRSAGTPHLGPYGLQGKVLPPGLHAGHRPDAPGGNACKLRPDALAANPLSAHGPCGDKHLGRR